MCTSVWWLTAEKNARPTMLYPISLSVSRLVIFAHNRDYRSCLIGSPTQDKAKVGIQQNSGRDGGDWRADWAGSEREAQRNRIVRINTSDVWGPHRTS